VVSNQTMQDLDVGRAITEITSETTFITLEANSRANLASNVLVSMEDSNLVPPQSAESYSESPSPSKFTTYSPLPLKDAGKTNIISEDSETHLRSIDSGQSKKVKLEDIPRDHLARVIIAILQEKTGKQIQFTLKQYELLNTKVMILDKEGDTPNNYYLERAMRYTEYLNTRVMEAFAPHKRSVTIGSFIHYVTQPAMNYYGWFNYANMFGAGIGLTPDAPAITQRISDREKAMLENLASKKRDPNQPITFPAWMT